MLFRSIMIAWTLLITVAILQVSLLATTIYLHRAMSHRSLDLHPLAANLMHLELSLFTGIVPREWVAVHRKHHHFSDREGDPHSPRLYGLWRVLWCSCYYCCRESRSAETLRKYTPDYRPDRVDRLPGLHFGALGGLGIFMLMFGWAWGLAAWCFHIAAYILVNSAINSFCHVVGYRNFDNLATNVPILALLVGGEGLHNNHHEYPSSAKLAMRRGEIEIGRAHV